MFRVADLAIRNHALRIEFHLHLHVLRGDLQRASQLGGELAAASSGEFMKA